MSKHTPGPWFFGEDRTVIEGSHPGGYSVVVAETFGYKEMREANARLIALAPELLTIVEHLAQGFATEGYLEAQARALLARLD